MTDQDQLCPRCGFSCSELPISPTVNGWPEDLPTPPPLPKCASPHPIGVCCSPFEIGEKLYWNMDMPDEDMAPPIMVVFKELVEIQSAHFALQNNKWIKEGEPTATIARVGVVRKFVFPRHKRLFGDLLNHDLEVAIKSLTPVDLWPVIELV